jgi:catechol 2,3-dioxygenase-like lactoylglutathione lyase family enzyme
VPDATELDHVAIALADRAPFWATFGRDLGGRWVGGGESPAGFAVGQLRFANGMKVEGIEPFPPGAGAFLERFLTSNGPGPHHLTFKVPDLEAMLERSAASGYEPLGVDLSGEHWKEGFLHPRQACGIVVQLAWAAGELEGPPPPELADPPSAPAAELVHVAHAVADLEAGLRLFKGLLGGQTVDAGAGGGLGWVDLAWPGPGRLRLVAGDPVRAWIGTRAGRLHHVAFRLRDPGAVTGAVRHDDGWEVEPTGALGTRLVLVEADRPVPPSA